jgi:O-antigen/teichoic acid export membrane protein
VSDQTNGEGLGDAIQRGVAWKIGSQVFLQGARIVFAFALARLLTPREYGLAGMALIFSGFVLAFADLGLGAALVQRQKLTERDRSTVFWTSLASGLALTLAGIALSGPVARLFGEPQVQGLLAALSLSFLITSLAVTQRSLLTRELDFRRLELRVMASTLVGGLVGVGLAYAGFGAWALVGQALAIAAVSTLALWVVTPWRPHFTFSLHSLRSMGGFSGSVFGERLLYYSTETVTGTVIGKNLGAAALGTFTVANNVVLLPFSRIAIPIGEVLFPAFSRIQHDTQRLAGMWLRAIPLLSAICLPALAGLCVLAPDFVSVVLGDQWDAAVPVIQILCWVGIVNTLRSWNVNILMSLGHGKLLIRFAVAFFVAYLVGTLVGMHWGIVGVAVGFALAATSIEAPYLWIVMRQLGVPISAVWRALSGVIQATLLMALVVLAARLGLVEAGLGAALRLVLLIVLGIAVYGLACRWRAPEVVSELREQLRRRRRSSVPTGAAQPVEQ